MLTVCWQQRGTEPESSSNRPQEREQQLARLYGRAQYEGARRTLKTTPYLHFSTPGSLLSRRPRPRLVESIRGQSSTSHSTIHDPLKDVPVGPRRRLSLRRCEDEVLQDTDQFGFTPKSPLPGASPIASPCPSSGSRDLCWPSSKGHSFGWVDKRFSHNPPPLLTQSWSQRNNVWLWVPAGRCRVKSFTRYPKHPQEVTSTKAKAPPTATVATVVERQPQVRLPTSAPQGGRGGRQSLIVLVCSDEWCCWQAAEEPGPSALVDTGSRSEEEGEKEKGVLVFPGADFLSIADITQVVPLSSCSASTAAGSSSRWSTYKAPLINVME